MWHMWTRPGGGGAPYPQLWDVGSHTGLEVPLARRGVAQMGAFGPGQQAGTTAVQYDGGVAGMFLNTTAMPPADNSTLGTVTMGQSWPQTQWLQVWGTPGSGAFIRVSGYFRVPYAHRTCTGTHCAVYVVATVGLHDAVAGTFVWYSVSLFDYKRPHSEHVFVDTFSHDVIIQVGVAIFLGCGQRCSGGQHSRCMPHSNQRWWDDRSCGTIVYMPIFITACHRCSARGSAIALHEKSSRGCGVTRRRHAVDSFGDVISPYSPL